MNRFRLFDILLMPRELFMKIGTAKWTLVPAVLVVGSADVITPLTDKLPAMFEHTKGTTVATSILLTLLAVIFMGIVDILFFSIPLFVLFNHYNKNNEATRQPATFIKFIKVYALSHLLIIPVNELVYFAGSRLNPASSKAFLAVVAIYFYFIMRFWFAGVITRGINVLYSFTPVYGNLVFFAVFFWNLLLGEALSFFSDRLVAPFIM